MFPGFLKIKYTKSVSYKNKFYFIFLSIPFLFEYAYKSNIYITSRVHFSIFSIVIVIIFSNNWYNYFRKLTFRCRCSRRYSRSGSATGCCTGGWTGCCTSCCSSEFSDARIRSASITLIKHIWKLIISSPSISRKNVLITRTIWWSLTLYGSFCHFSLRWNLFNNNHDLRRLFQVCGQFPGVHPFSSAHSLLNTEQPFSLPPPRPQELFTLNVLQLPSLSFCDKEISPL